jgi:hypothetical protein
MVMPEHCGRPGASVELPPRNDPDMRERKVKLEVLVGPDGEGRWWVIALVEAPQGRP